LRSVVVALLLVLGSCGQDRTEEGPIVGLSVSAPTIDFPVPEFELVDQRGKKFTRADMVGSVFVVDFVFTSCPKVCPELTKKMAALSKKLRSTQRPTPRSGSSRFSRNTATSRLRGSS
jgi:cytochrome oxidase Cu insertion factor (SCO1/SenC/PrrC family)